MSDNPKIWCFGDSWAYGSELKKNEEPFIHWISLALKLPYINLGQEGRSLGVIVHDIVQKCHLISHSDIVFVIIPPDVRWYDQNRERGFYSITTNTKRENLEQSQELPKQWVGGKTKEWFTYHHAIFIYIIQKIFNDINCKYVLAHNFGKLEIDKYNLKIDKSKFLSTRSLQSLLTNTDNIELKDTIWGIDSNICTGNFFEGCRFGHPNELGHKLIAKMLLHKLKNI